MTEQQIRYGELLETRRSHLTNERQNQQNLDETARSHLANEGIARDTLSENSRHNRVTENISERNLQETIQHNRETERLGWSNLGENRRHNMATESISKTQTQASLMQAEASKLNAAVNATYRPQEVAIAQQNADTAYSKYQLEWLRNPTQIDLMNAQLGNYEASSNWYNTQSNYKLADTVIDAFGAAGSTLKGVSSIISATK